MRRVPNNLLTYIAEAWVVSCVVWHWYSVLVTTGQNVERSVSTLLKLVSAHESSYARVLHLLLEHVTLVVHVKVLVYDVESCTAMVFLARIVLYFGLKDGVLVTFIAL